MSSRSIKAARAFVEVYMDDEKLQRGIKRVQARMRSMAAGTSKVGGAMFAGAAAAAAPLIAAVSTFVAKGDEIDKMSKRTGIATETLSQMGFALEQSGGQLADFQRGLKGMANFLQGAERGLSTSTDTLSDLGITLSDLESKTPDERFLLFADSISAVTDPTRRAALAMDVFGRAGESMLPLLAEGPGAIAALRSEADRLGRTITKEQADAAAKLGDSWNRLKSVFLGVAMQIGGALAPSITRLTDFIAENSTAVTAWVKEHQAMIVVIAKGVAVVGLVGGALLTVGGILGATAFAIGGVTTAVGALSIAFAFLAANPVVLAITAVVLLVTALALLYSGVEVPEALSASFSSFSNVLKQVLIDLKNIQGVLNVLAPALGIVVALSPDELPDVSANSASASPVVSGIEEGLANFERLVEDFTNGSIATATVNASRPKSVGQQQDSKDLRTVSGFSELVKAFDGGGIAGKQLRELQRQTGQADDLLNLVANQKGHLVG